ncbi:MAG: hypothetical protein Q7J20_01980 [Candidatus Nitrotoga sp.]|nr:hypothetical protein [Candidatus Nitrotoga sp.]MDO9446682.1 hypothetical protein [Candidatus Nitrotoga sp.]MDP3496246.1 hypothetical protein [Candidatus Nitrotoga sp.]
MSLQLNAPQPLATTHILDQFECGEDVLDEWLKRRAMVNQVSGASRTFLRLLCHGCGGCLAPDGNQFCVSKHARSRSGDGSGSIRG